MTDDSFASYVLEQLAAVEDLRSRRMFGGHGIYSGGRFFGIVHGGRLYLKTDAESRAEFERRGMGPFQPNSDQVLKSYFEVPADVLEQPEQLILWARRSARIPT